MRKEFNNILFFIVVSTLAFLATEFSPGFYFTDNTMSLFQVIVTKLFYSTVFVFEHKDLVYHMGGNLLLLGWLLVAFNPKNIGKIFFVGLILFTFLNAFTWGTAFSGRGMSGVLFFITGYYSLFTMKEVMEKEAAVGDFKLNENKFSYFQLLTIVMFFFGAVVSTLDPSLLQISGYSHFIGYVLGLLLAVVVYLTTRKQQHHLFLSGMSTHIKPTLDNFYRIYRK